MRTIKTIPILLLTAILFTACAGPGALNMPKNEAGAYEYQEVVDVPGKSQTELFDRIKEWVAINYRSAQDVIQLDDRENGQLIAKGYFPITLKLYERHIYNSLRIETRDGRYRYTMNDFEIYTPSTGERMVLERAYMGAGDGDKINAEVMALMASIENYMQEEEEEW